eukprot:Filipodium_phascolosomae@DN2651_c0_g1_i1.p1
MDLASSVGSFEVTSELCRPNSHKMIHAVALILSDQIEEGESLRSGLSRKPDKPEWHIFNEANYFKNEKRCFLNGKVLRVMDRRPKSEDIRAFLKTMLDSIYYPPECNVLILLYVNRLMSACGLYMHTANWRPLLMTALVISQKVWDDPQMKNTDFAYYYTFFKDEELTAMEVTFLQLLQYKVVVKTATFAKYYYELRTVFPPSGRPSDYQEDVVPKSVRRLNHRSKVYAKSIMPRGMWHKTIS